MISILLERFVLWTQRIRTDVMISWQMNKFIDPERRTRKSPHSVRTCKTPSCSGQSTKTNAWILLFSGILTYPQHGKVARFSEVDYAWFPSCLRQNEHVSICNAQEALFARPHTQQIMLENPVHMRRHKLHCSFCMGLFLPWNISPLTGHLANCHWSAAFASQEQWLSEADIEAVIA